LVVQRESLTERQIREAAKIQLAELRTGFLSSLGEDALCLIFTSFAKNEAGILLIASDTANNSVIGYALAARDTKAAYRQFLASDSRAALRIFVPKLLSAARLRRALETLLYPFRRSDDGVVDLPKAELLDIAVAGDYQGQGVGQLLFEALVEEFRNAGLCRFAIPTSASLASAHRFYEARGAVRAKVTEVHAGETTYLYLFELAETRSDSD
jgi:GNAT superfamily N-acetyltransferase